MRQQKAYSLVDLMRLDHVVVVQGQDRVDPDGAERIQQGGQDRLDGRRLGGLEQGQGRGAQARLDPVQRCQDVAPEAHLVIVARVQGEPSQRDRAAGWGRAPGTEQSGLAVAGRRRDERERAPQPCVQAVGQVRTRHQDRPRLRNGQLGRQEGGALQPLLPPVVRRRGVTRAACCRL